MNSELIRQLEKSLNVRGRIFSIVSFQIDNQITDNLWKMMSEKLTPNMFAELPIQVYNHLKDTK